MDAVRQHPARMAAVDLQARTGPDSPGRRGPTWRRAGIVTGVAVLLLVAAGAVIPAAVHHTTWRNGLLNQALQKHGLSASADQSTGGWLTAFEFRNVVIRDQSGQLCCRIPQLRTNRTLLSHLFADDRRTEVTLIRPSMEISLDQDGRLSLESTETNSDDVAFELEDAEFVLRVSWRDLPIVDLDGLHIRGSIVSETDGRWLSMEHIDVLDRTELSERHTQQNLALVAPLISQATSLNGTVSARLNPIRVCLDRQVTTNPVLLNGTVHIHSMDARLRREWSRSILQLTGHLTQTSVPENLQLVSDCLVEFHVTSAGIHHTGFSVVLPDAAEGLTVTSSGILRLNDQIDLDLRVQLPVWKRSSSRFLNALSGLLTAPLPLRVTGPVSDPQIIMADGRTPNNFFLRPVEPAQHAETAGTIAGSIRHIIQASAARDESERKSRLPQQIFGLIRAIDSANQKAQLND